MPNSQDSQAFAEVCTHCLTPVAMPGCTHSYCEKHGWVVTKRVPVATQSQTNAQKSHPPVSSSLEPPKSNSDSSSWITDSTPRTAKHRRRPQSVDQATQLDLFGESI